MEANHNVYAATYLVAEEGHSFYTALHENVFVYFANAPEALPGTVHEGDGKRYRLRRLGSVVQVPAEGYSDVAAAYMGKKGGASTAEAQRDAGEPTAEEITRLLNEVFARGGAPVVTPEGQGRGQEPQAPAVPWRDAVTARFLTPVAPKSLEGWFAGCADLRFVCGFANVNMAHVRSMTHLFAGCSRLESVDCGALNVLHDVDACDMFDGCRLLGSPDDVLARFLAGEKISTKTVERCRDGSAASELSPEEDASWAARERDAECFACEEALRRCRLDVSEQESVALAYRFAKACRMVQLGSVDAELRDLILRYAEEVETLQHRLWFLKGARGLDLVHDVDGLVADTDPHLEEHEAMINRADAVLAELEQRAGVDRSGWWDLAAREGDTVYVARESTRRCGIADISDTDQAEAAQRGEEINVSLALRQHVHYLHAVLLEALNEYCYS